MTHLNGDMLDIVYVRCCILLIAVQFYSQVTAIVL